MNNHLIFKSILAFIFGGVFALGLIISGMSNPAKVQNFLDIFGTWDASLAFVMIGANLVAFIPFQNVLRREYPQTIFLEPIMLPSNSQIDAKLITGAVLFGSGWGIAGICPAPSLTLIGLGHYQVLYFIVAMLVGMLMHRQIFERTTS